MSDSTTTKKAIAKGFKGLMFEKRFDKITISDIAKSCGINRQTFYYHFRDKYDLLDWIYYNEAIHYLVDDLTLDNWSDKVYEMLKTMKAESYFYINAFKASGSKEFESYLTHAVQEMFQSLIDQLAKGVEMDSRDREFIASFYAFGLVGIIVSWTHARMPEDPEDLKRRFENLVLGTKKVSADRL
ncbi:MULTISPECIES: dihydroxyacetone kinase transcriptional activator DhaS [Eubacterium]|uniref:Probable dihydroxyacetone kinase regulator n=1 Tax=Eubacterium barkeri TaxID=1528 RepID=A0A1H3D690_EUBBA|nr:dihydroxyacetone kinase transcriptional activator DhaS [Eubacterium barkeri]SDX61897.1 probable dihydroxyacetone kinase regulator [Eubacterium barkeri]